jgi:tetratricopeptide (TPR) repeat protein
VEIPYSFQYQLDVSHAVGRIDFETPEEYRRYAHSVVQAESEMELRNKTAAIFVPTYAWDPSSSRRLHEEQLVEKVKATIEQAGRNRGWSIQQPYIGGQANKAALDGLMRGTTKPALIFAAGHGVRLSRGNSQQREQQGGLFCAGGQAGAGTRPEKDKSGYFVAEDLPKHSKVHGLIAILAASNSAGSPEYDGFSLPWGGRRKRDVVHPFVARLAQRLLSHRKGGALAIIGRIERYASTVTESTGLTGADVYSADADMLRALQKLLEGYPVGAVLEPLNRRYAELASDLFENVNTSSRVTAAQKKSAERRLAKIVEARSWAIIGDPAVRLAVPDIFPDMAALSKVYQSQKLEQDAKVQARNGKMESAISLFNNALDTNPALGIDPEREAQRINSRYQYEKLYEKGSKLATMGRIRDAERTFSRAKVFEPDSKLEPRLEAHRKAVPYYQAQGERLASKGKVDQAIAQFVKAKRYGDAEIDPSVMAANLAVPYLMKEGRAAAARGDVETAVKHFQKVASLKPNPNWDLEAEARALAREFWIKQGEKLAKRGQQKVAVAAFQKAKELVPSQKIDPEALANKVTAKTRDVPDVHRVKKLKRSFGLKEKLWAPGTVLRIRFLDGKPEVHRKVLKFAREWTKFANLKFVESEDFDAEIRVSFMQPGSWAYLGTAARLVPTDQPTINFGWLTSQTPHEESLRVVLHEFGRILGLTDEHQSPNANIQWNKKRVYAKLSGPPNYWPKQQIDQNIFKKYSSSDMKILKEFDPKSIMMRPFPKEFTLDDSEYELSKTLSDIDKEAIGRLYPFTTNRKQAVPRKRVNSRKSKK